MIKILTSGFKDIFPEDFIIFLNRYIKEDNNFVFIASEFENMYEKTDWYCNYFLKMFSDCGITFKSIKVIDNRISKENAEDIVRNADVLWLAGGDTPKQFAYFEDYGLIKLIREHKGVIIGMSAGAINMTKTAICTLTCGHNELKIYEGLGLVDFSVEPHFDKDNITDELLAISKEYPFYGICDDGAIICTDGEMLICGDVFYIDNGQINKV